MKSQPGRTHALGSVKHHSKRVSGRTVEIGLVLGGLGVIEESGDSVDRVAVGKLGSFLDWGVLICLISKLSRL